MANKNESEQHCHLFDAIRRTLDELEVDGDIVICATSTAQVAKRLYEASQDFVPSEKIKHEELIGLRAVLYLILKDRNLIDWEFPTLTGLKRTDLEVIINKLPKG